MGSDVTVTSPQARTARRRFGTLDRAWEHLPFRAVVLPWLVARALLVPMIVLTSPTRSFDAGRLIWMDGQWFRAIALDWYDRPYASGGWSEYPFFPLFPSLGGALMHMGVPTTAALTSISWIAALAAMAGAYRLAVRHLPPESAAWAPWFLAIAPGSLTMVLGYSDSLYLAGLVWSLVLAEDRRWWAAGALAAVATASRPNGVIALIAVVVTVLVARAGYRVVVAVALPSVSFLVAWCIYLWWATGDPLVFWSAKAAWMESTIQDVLSGLTLSVNRPALFHLFFAFVLTTAYIMRARRQPIAWAFVTALTVMPPLLLGVVGLARYAILAFPMAFAAADLITARSRWLSIAWLSLSALAMVFLTVRMNRQFWVP